MIKKMLAAMAMMALATPTFAETVDVKYVGPVDLTPFSCADTVSSFVNRVCFDEATGRVVVLLKATYYQYCDVDGGTVAAWLAADSKGRFYNQNIRSNAVAGRFACND